MTGPHPIGNEELQAAILEREKLAALFGEVGMALTQGASLRGILDRCVKALVSGLDAAFARIWILEEHSQELVLQASAGLYTHLNGAHGRVPVGEFKIGLIAEERKPHLTNSVIGDPRVGDQDWAKREGMVAFAGYPLIVGQDLVGVVAIFARRPLSSAVLQALETIAHGVALAIRRNSDRNALRVSDARKTAILNNSLDCIITVDEQGRLIEFNPAAERTFGYRYDQVIGRVMLEVLFPVRLQAEFASSLAAYVSGTEAQKHVIRTETLAVRSDGSEFPVEIGMVSIPLDEKTLVTIYLRDITSRKAADQEHQRLLADTKAAQESYRQLAEAMPQQVWTALPDGSLDYINQRVLDYCDSDAPTLLGKGWVTIVHPDDVEGCVARWMDSIRNGTPYEVEFRLLRTKDQMYRWHLGRAVPMRASDGSVVRWLGTNTDIHDRKAFEAELGAAKAAADAANQAKSQFLASMSHELRTPLNAVIGYSEMLQEEVTDLGLNQLIPDIQRIYRAGGYLLSLINNVLDLSKIEAGKMELTVEKVNIPDLIQATAETAQPLFERNRNRLEVACSPDAGVIYCDSTKLRQCLLNLLSNAAKFTNDGLIRLEVSKVYGYGSGQAKYLFRVTDSGHGMTEQEIAGLFVPFTQTKAGLLESQAGTGLGLAITRQFCRLMGGEIFVESEPGKGSSFTIELPAGSPPSEVEAEILSPSLPVNSQRRRIALLVDDDAGTRELMLRLLRKEGYDAVTAGDGREALRLARELHPSFITLDVMMPGMDGWAVLSALKADPELAGIPVIMVSIVDDHQMGYALGATEYLTKPVDRRRLKGLVEKYFSDDSIMKVLIVEDDEPTRSLLKRSMEDMKWSVTETANGESALASMEENAPTIVLLDLLLPGLDGFEVAFAIRRNPNWRQIPIIVMTAMDLTLEDRKRLNGKVSAILSKGAYTYEELHQEIRDLAARSGKG